MFLEFILEFKITLLVLGPSRVFKPVQPYFVARVFLLVRKEYAWVDVIVSRRIEQQGIVFSSMIQQFGHFGVCE